MEKELKKRKRKNISLRKKSVTVVLIASIVLSLIAVIISGGFYAYSTFNHYKELAEQLADTAASQLSAKDIVRYYDEVKLIGDYDDDKYWSDDAYRADYDKKANALKDEKYKQMLNTLFVFADQSKGRNEIKYIYVQVLEKDKVTYIFDADHTEDQYQLGTVRPVSTETMGMKDREYGVPAFISNTPDDGWLCSCMRPVLDDSGNPTEEMTDTFVYNAQTLDRVIAHELTHGVMINRFKNFNELPSWIVEGGSAELVHGADSRIAASDSYLSSAGAFKAAVFDLPPGATGADAPHAYDGGFIAMRFMMAVGNVNASDGIKKFMEVLDRGGTLNEAVHSGSGGIWGSTDTFVNSFVGELDSYVGKGVENGTYADTTEAATAFLKEKCGIDLENDDTGSITGSDAGGKLTKTGSSVVHEIGSPVNWRMPSSNSTMIGGIEVRWPAGMSVANENGGNMVFHIGAKANDAFNVGFNDMRARSIGLYDEAGEKLNVTTQARAKAAIHTLNKIVDLVVDQQANIGAMLQRLDYTASNLTVSSENVQAAESTIRDADMAKEMTNYTKNNVLLQASQSMLAQANQNSSAVLSLLQ